MTHHVLCYFGQEADIARLQGRLHGLHQMTSASSNRPQRHAQPPAPPGAKQSSSDTALLSPAARSTGSDADALAAATTQPTNEAPPLPAAAVTATDHVAMASLAQFASSADDSIVSLLSRMKAHENYVQDVLKDTASPPQQPSSQPLSAAPDAPTSAELSSALNTGATVSQLADSLARNTHVTQTSRDHAVTSGSSLASSSVAPASTAQRLTQCHSEGLSLVNSCHMTGSSDSRSQSIITGDVDCAAQRAMVNTPLAGAASLHSFDSIISSAISSKPSSEAMLEMLRSNFATSDSASATSDVATLLQRLVASRSDVASSQSQRWPLQSVMTDLGGLTQSVNVAERLTAMTSDLSDISLRANERQQRSHARERCYNSNNNLVTSRSLTSLVTSDEDSVSVATTDAESLSARSENLSTHPPFTSSPKLT